MYTDPHLKRVTIRDPVKSKAGRKSAAKGPWRTNFKLAGSATDGIRKPPLPAPGAREGGG